MGRACAPQQTTTGTKSAAKRGHHRWAGHKLSSCGQLSSLGAAGGRWDLLCNTHIECHAALCMHTDFSHCVCSKDFSARRKTLTLHIIPQAAVSCTYKRPHLCKSCHQAVTPLSHLHPSVCGCHYHCAQCSCWCTHSCASAAVTFLCVLCGGRRKDEYCVQDLLPPSRV